MNVDDLPVPELAAEETERESAIEAILSDVGGHRLRPATAGHDRQLAQCTRDSTPSNTTRYQLAEWPSASPLAERGTVGTRLDARLGG